MCSVKRRGSGHGKKVKVDVVQVGVHVGGHAIRFCERAHRRVSGQAGGCQGRGGAFGNSGWCVHVSGRACKSAAHTAGRCE